MSVLKIIGLVLLAMVALVIGNLCIAAANPPLWVRFVGSLIFGYIVGRQLGKALFGCRSQN